MLIITPKLKIPLREFDFTFARSAGPGGQNVNKLNTKATLRWEIMTSPSLPDDVRDRFVKKNRRRINKEGQLVITSQRFRDQGRNVADCLEKLRALLAAAAVVPRKRKRTKPTAAAKRRRLKEKREQSERKSRRRAVRRDDE